MCAKAESSNKCIKLKSSPTAAVRLNSEQRDPLFVMDSGLWSKLPEELIEQVLARLPFIHKIRFRCVCKKWNALPSFPSFSQLCSQVSFSRPSFIVCRELECGQVDVCYSDGFGTWHVFPPNSLPGFVRCEASSSGLICCSAPDGPSRKYYICNPITKTWKELPTPLEQRVPLIVGMAMAPNTRDFKIVLAGGVLNSHDYFINGYCNITTEIYDSKSDCWKRTSNMPRISRISGGPVFCNGLLYCLAYWPVRGLLAYNLEEESWDWVKSPWPDSSWPIRILKHRGCISMFGKFYMSGFGMWQLDPEDLSWSKIGRTPCFNYRSSPYYTEGVEIAGHSDLIMFFLHEEDKARVYDVSQQAWHWLPSCPFRTGTRRLFSFDPVFDDLGYGVIPH